METAVALKVAIIGSRKGIPKDTVISLAKAVWKEGIYDTVVSGGADGVDLPAEEAWLHLGGTVISFRPHERANHYTVDRWVYGDAIGIPSIIDLRQEGHPTFGDWKSAAFYRNMLIAEEAYKGYALWNGFSAGTSHGIDCFRALNKTIHIGTIARAAA